MKRLPKSGPFSGMDRNFRFLLVFLVGLNILWAAAFIGRSLSSSGQRPGQKPAAAPAALGNAPLETAVKYTVYVGLNDKDEYRQLVPTDAAVERLNRVAMQYADGFTVRRAQGFWKDEHGNPTSEQTIVYDFLDISDGQMADIMKGMISAMNQNSVLVEKAETKRTFFSE